MNAPLFCPPRTRPMAELPSLARVIWRGDGDLLSLVPAKAYRQPMCTLGQTRRSIVMVSDPVLVRRIMTEDMHRYPKSDLMQEALRPLVGDSIFVSGGATWERQRRMINPAFSHMKVSLAFNAMRDAVQDALPALDRSAAAGEQLSLDLLTSHLTADAITRTVFSMPLQSQTAHAVFESFITFERSVAQVRLLPMILSKAWADTPQRPEVLAACARIRELLGELVDAHATRGTEDIAASMREARDADEVPFTREELIDQIGVMFLAGHETTASALTWILYLISMVPAVRERLLAEIKRVAGDDPVSFEHVREMTYVRNVFRETLRLYPPITFMPRVALEDARIGGRKVKRGALIMISPWVMHRHLSLWKDPDAFDPDRFSPEREADLPEWGYIPFGQGPRICVGQAFAHTEAVLMLAELLRRYDFEPLAPGTVRPVARLTTRPETQILCRIRRRHAGP
jgi:cytochrome P450